MATKLPYHVARTTRSGRSSSSSERGTAVSTAAPSAAPMISGRKATNAQATPTAMATAVRTGSTSDRKSQPSAAPHSGLISINTTALAAAVVM